MKTLQHSVPAAAAATALFALLAQAAPSPVTPTLNNRLFKRAPTDYTQAWGPEISGADRASPPLIKITRGDGSVANFANFNNEAQAQWFCGTSKARNDDCCKKLCDITDGCVFANHLDAHLSNGNLRYDCSIYNTHMEAGEWIPNPGDPVPGTVADSRGYDKKPNKIRGYKLVGQDGSHKLLGPTWFKSYTYQPSDSDWGDCGTPVVVANSNPNLANVVTIKPTCLYKCQQALQQWNLGNWNKEDPPKRARSGSLTPEFMNAPAIGGGNILKYTCALYEDDYSTDPQPSSESYQGVWKNGVLQYTRIPGGVVVFGTDPNYTPFTP
ncbi:hypothetical protein TWF696_001378 [Orbilia brochopaga]|uniref:Uncharacterized protein n=1 Tax=Orbilia brochopaga TaxID=3140254 RepID=A0AAV9UCX9_9PEZI